MSSAELSIILAKLKFQVCKDDVPIFAFGVTNTANPGHTAPVGRSSASGPVLVLILLSEVHVASSIFSFIFFYSIDRQGTIDDFATIPFHLVMFSAILV